MSLGDMGVHRPPCHISLNLKYSLSLVIWIISWADVGPLWGALARVLGSIERALVCSLDLVDRS